MSMSGIDVGEKTMEVFNVMKLKTTTKQQQQNVEEGKTKYQLLVLEIDSNNIIQVKTDASKEICSNDEFRDFLGEHPKDPYYVIYDFHLPGKGRDSKKLIGIAWIPDNSPVKKRMKYASTFEGIKGKFEGVKWCGAKHEQCDCDDKEIMMSF